MTKDEALRLALEAFKYTGLKWPQVEEAITAIEAALEAKDEPMKKLQVTLEDRPVDIELAQYKRMFEDACANLGAINQALGLDFNNGGAESIIFAIEELKGRSQEPVAWMVYTLDGKSVCVTDNPTNFTPEHRALPLYTTPPQRKPCGLECDCTDVCKQDDYKALWQQMCERCDELDKKLAQRKPLTDEQAKDLLKHSDLLDMFEHIGWYSAPKNGFNKHGISLIRAIEAAHGIKGEA